MDAYIEGVNDRKRRSYNNVYPEGSQEHKSYDNGFKDESKGGEWIPAESVEFHP